MTDSIPDIDRLLCNHPTCDEQIIDAMVASYRAKLTRLACAYLGDADEAEDAVQQLFITAALKLNQYHPGSNFKAWLYTIAANTCRGALRTRKRRRALARLLGMEPSQPEPGPEEAVQKNDETRQLWSAVASLGEKQRMVVILRYEQGLSIQEIARILSIPEKTVYNRLYGAFQKLRQRLAADELESGAEKLRTKEVNL